MGPNGVSVGFDGCAKFGDVREMILLALVVRIVHDGARLIEVDFVGSGKDL